MRTGVVNLPLHTGKAPRWLFGRMVKLAKAITEVIVYEYNQDEFLRRLSNPYWFQGLGCVLGFDWHSSGLTTTTCGALREALKDAEIGIKICGGKGNTSRKTPDEILNCNFSLSTKKINKLIYASKLSAKVDNSLVQDNYQLYHHCFIFTEKGNWAVIQQGMNNYNNYARRYHWLSEEIESFVDEPQTAICCDKKEKNVLDMTNKENEEIRKASVDLVNDFTMQKNHLIKNMEKRNIEILRKAAEIQPENYEELVAIKGIGPKAIRSLALTAEIIYGNKLTWKDPVKYSFAHGGKDGIHTVSY